MNYDIGIRVEMGDEIGSGHFYRCLAISKELKARKKSVVFLVSNKKNFLKHVKGKIPYFEIKGNTEKAQIENSKKNLKKIHLLIIDLSKQNQKYSKELSNLKKTVVIDDFGNKKIFSELLFNGSIVKKFHNYTIAKKSCKTFFGPKYMILRNQFLENRQNFRITKKPIKKILLSFGGNDDKHLTLKFLKILQNKNFKITIVVGPTNPDQKAISSMVKKMKHIRIRNSVKNMAKLLTEQDLVICSTGITVYEVACLGTPCIMLPSKKLMPVAKEIEKRGFGINYGLWDNNPSKILTIISKLDSFKKRKKMFANGRSITDGKGVQRITSKILKLL